MPALSFFCWLCWVWKSLGGRSSCAGALPRRSPGYNCHLLGVVLQLQGWQQDWSLGSSMNPGSARDAVICPPCLQGARITAIIVIIKWYICYILLKIRVIYLPTFQTQVRKRHRHKAAGAPDWLNRVCIKNLYATFHAYFLSELTVLLRSLLCSGWLPPQHPSPHLPSASTASVLPLWVGRNPLGHSLIQHSE